MAGAKYNFSESLILSRNESNVSLLKSRTARLVLAAGGTGEVGVLIFGATVAAAGKGKGAKQLSAKALPESPAGTCVGEIGAMWANVVVAGPGAVDDDANTPGSAVRQSPNFSPKFSCS